MSMWKAQLPTLGNIDAKCEQNPNNRYRDAIKPGAHYCPPWGTSMPNLNKIGPVVVDKFIGQISCLHFLMYL